jgi:hypothetical protein
MNDHIDPDKLMAERIAERNKNAREWYGANSARIKQERKLRYANDPEYREMIARSRKRQKERQKKASEMSIQPRGNIIQNRKIKKFKVEHDSLGSCVAEFLSVGQTAAKLGIKVPTIRKWEREGYIPPALYRTKGGHRLYTRDQVSSLQEAFTERKQMLASQNRKWSLEESFYLDIKRRWDSLPNGVATHRFVK